jgi:threonine/homoserine/homoserine lactone efflux protein
MELLMQILSVLLLGIVGGSIPGPIMATTFTESVRRGFNKSLLVIFRAFIAESIVAIFILTLFFSFNIPQFVFYLISFAGAAMLLYLAVQVWKINKIGEEGEIFSFWKIFLLTILNGPFLLFWITICVPQAFLLREQIPQGHIVFLLLFELGWIIAITAWTFIFSRFRIFLTKEHIVPIVFKTFSLILLCFAITLLINGLKFFV